MAGPLERYTAKVNHLKPTRNSCMTFHQNFPFRRTVAGGFSFFLIKGLLKLYYKQQQYRRQIQRTVLNFEETNRQEQAGGNREEQAGGEVRNA